MTQTILADQPDARARVLGGAPCMAAARGGRPPESGERAERHHACLLVPCDWCGASQYQPCPDAEPCGVRRLLAVERGHLDPDTGAWLTKWALGGIGGPGYIGIRVGEG